MRRLRPWVVAVILILPQLLRAQASPSDLSENAACTFADGKDLSVHFANTPSPKKDKDFPQGKVWAPGDVPLPLFTSTPLVIGKTDAPIGAYNLYFIPAKDSWTLIVSRNVTAGAKYDETQDLVRAPMEVEKLPQPVDQLSVYFGHVAPKVCTMRLDYGKVRATFDFNEK